MSAAVKPRATRRAGHQVKKYKGCVLTRVGSRTVEVAMPSGAIWGWAASWRQARAVVNWLSGGSRCSSSEDAR
jgi:hypothetical protein